TPNPSTTRITVAIILVRSNTILPNASFFTLYRANKKESRNTSSAENGIMKVAIISISSERYPVLRILGVNIVSNSMRIADEIAIRSRDLVNKPRILSKRSFFSSSGTIRGAAWFSPSAAKN
ncbi:unnamed protein product, partial [marine sediment metagenome]